MARVSPLLIIPPAIFAGLVAFFLVWMQRENPDDLPSAFLGKPAPELRTEALAGREIVTDEDLRQGGVTLINFWASWCPPCRAEHPTLQALSDEGIRVAGVNFKDEESQANRYLDGAGDPFFGIIYDPQGRTAINWGVTAPPETFIVDGEGNIVFRFAGPLIGADYQNRFRPELDKALNDAAKD